MSHNCLILGFLPEFSQFLNFLSRKKNLLKCDIFWIIFQHCAKKQRTVFKMKSHSSIFQMKKRTKKSLVAAACVPMIFIRQRNFTRPQAVSGLRKALSPLSVEVEVKGAASPAQRSSARTSRPHFYAAFIHGKRLR